jgi:hypothetical protein
MSTPHVIEIPSHSILGPTPAQVQELIAQEEAAAKRLASLRYERERAELALRTD